MFLLEAAVAFPAFLAFRQFVEPRPSAYLGRLLPEQVTPEITLGLLPQSLITFTTAVATLAQFAGTVTF